MIRAKKGDLALSVNAIVIVVISFVVLGLALTLTRTIFKFAGERAESVIPLTELETKPTAENPISIPETISISRGGKLAQSVGYYNTNPFPAKQARFSIFDCLFSDPNSGTQKSVVRDLDVSSLPTVISPAQDVQPSQAKAYKIIINENKLRGGINYICKLVVHHSRFERVDLVDELDKREPDKVYDTKEIFLNVIA